MHTLSCIKCRASYQSEDPDPYYCSPCNEQRKAVAAQVEATIGNRPSKKKVMSGLQEYEAAPKVRGFMVVKL